jgi:hypothetical protein
MKRFFYFVLSVIMGVAGVLAYQKYYVPKNAQPDTGMAGDAELSTTLGRFRSNPDGGSLDDRFPDDSKGESPGALISRTREPDLELVSPAVSRDAGVGLESTGFDAPTGDAPTLPRREKFESDVPVLGGDLIVEVDSTNGPTTKKEAAPSRFLGADIDTLQAAGKEGRQALEAGELQRGLALCRDIFRGARERDDVNLVWIVRKLAELSPAGPATVEYHQFLAVHDPDPSLRFRSGLAVGEILAKRKDAEDVRQAWELLSSAYKAARSKPERQNVLRVLEPFLKDHIFRGRFSPLLTSHTVRPGESLSLIAGKFGTTVDAIVRLNRLATSVIQPGQRLLALSGKVEVHVKKSDYRLWVLVDGKVLMEKRVGLGRDNCTPESTFVIDQRQKDPTWYRRGKASVPPGDPNNILGTRWLGFKDSEEYQGFGIHGTRDAGSIGKQQSSGCIRLDNHHIEELWDFVPMKAVVTIVE